MKKLFTLIIAAMMAAGVMAQDFCGVSCKDGQVYHDWNKWLDYINIVEPLDINNYETIYLCPVDISKVKWPDKSDNKHPALEESLKAFPGIIAKSITKQFSHLKVQTVNSLNELQLDEKSLGLCLRFDELDQGDLSLRIWVGAGAGAQRVTIAGVFFDKDKNEFFDFRDGRVSIIGRSYKKDLQLELENFGKDLAKMLKTLSKK